jgi:RNA polymerase sigma factor (sigma-70 family)
MANTRHHPVLDYLRRVLGEPAGGVGDADLLRRFVGECDEAAFELLLWRHAAMVLHVCRQVLGDADAAEDAFQATFLVFVRKAGSISRRESLGSWLYRVAYRIALKARARLKPRSTAPEELDRLAAPAESEDVEQRELRRIVCEEVNRLPANYRAAVVACFFEGKTHEEAAKQLGWPRGTVAGRLARARELLHRRLRRRGVTLTMGALVAALTVRTAQAALAGLVDSVIHTARLLAAGQAAAAVVSPHVAVLAKGALQAMYWTKAKIAVIVLFLAGLGGVGVSLLATPEQNQLPIQSKAASASPPRWQPPADETPPAQPPQASKEDDEAMEEPPPEDTSPENAAKLARDMARSRLNLKQLALAMHNYNDVNQHLPLAATVGKNGRALLSWRVELLPYLGERTLYKQFKRDEPWDSPHNRKLLSKMPAVFAPPGVKSRQPYSTFYQVFVSVGPFSGGGMGGAGAAPMMGGMMQGGTAPAAGAPGGMRGMQPQGMPGAGSHAHQGPAGAGPGQGGGAGGGMAMPGMPGMAAAEAIQHFATAFIKGEVTRLPASIPDGTSNTILIVEAGNPVPWTKPEDLHYADDEPLPELGGLFPNVFHAAFADGAVHTLTKNYNEKQLRNAITANGGEVVDLSKIEARSRPRAGVGDRATVETWQRKNSELRKELELLRQQIRLLKEEQEVERELAGEDPRVRKLKEEHDHMQTELKKLRGEIESLKKNIRPPRNP